MEKSSFFNAVNGDRQYKASDLAEYFNSLVTNGVFPNPSAKLQVVANNNMTVTLKSGKAWINGYNYYNDSDLILSIDPADGVLNRIDRVVLRMDTVGRAINAKVKKGIFASTPMAQVLQRDADGYELGIADIYVGKGAISIVQANITDLRLNSSLCGLVSFIDPIDTTAIFSQYQGWYNTRVSEYEADMSDMEAQFQQDFNTWFNSIKNSLSGDIAGNLLNKINANTEMINNHESAEDPHPQYATDGELLNLNNAINKHLAETVPHAINTDITYYVNSSSGNDLNDGLTSGTAFKTIQSAINKLKPIINAKVTINIAAVATYNENVIYSWFFW